MSRSSSRPESIINSINDNSSDYTQSSEGLPSYQDVLREEQQGITYGNPGSSQNSNNLNVPRPPQRPPQKPPRPNKTSHTSTNHHHHHNSHNSAGGSSTSRPKPPPNSAPSSHQAKPSHRPPAPFQSQNIPSANSRIPWVYPSNFHCPKCNNTGYKLKNGKSCRSCWRRFAPTNPISYRPGPAASMFMSPMGMMAPPPPQQYGYNYGYPNTQPQPQQRQLVVRPGDPRLGGVVCGECRGSGRVSFFLDEDICTLCHGLGRIIPRY